MPIWLKFTRIRRKSILFELRLKQKGTKRTKTHKLPYLYISVARESFHSKSLPLSDTTAQMQPDHDDQTDVTLYGPMVPMAYRSRSPGGITRVMSPNPDEVFLKGFRADGNRCKAAVFEPAMCAQCGIYGHAPCLNLESFQGYSFCGICMTTVIQEYASFQDHLRREQWMRSLSAQTATW